ncbi:unnamed protein product, partial [Rotaria sp. Silwood1]
MSSEMNDESIVVAGRPPKKLALLIGNNNYEHGDKLKYCINDVHDVANELKQMGFQVTIGTDLPYVTMIQIILRFQRQINTDDLVVFFYSGHGIQWEDQNYLIAIDNKCLADDTEMYRHYAIRVQFILESMTKRRPSTIVFLLDCCRTYLTENQALSNTPLTKSIPENTTRTGLTTMKGVAGSLIVFACGPNEAVLEESKNGRNRQTCVLLPSSYRNEKLQNRIDECEFRSTVDLREQDLTDADMDIVLQQAIIKKQCKYLRLSQNQITSLGASIIASALKNFTSLETLNLCNNTISDSGVNSLSEKLSSNNSILKVLILAANRITDTGAQYLAQILQTNRTLVCLGLSFNEIGDQGVQSLSQALTQYNTTLQELYLNGNKLIGDSSVDSIISMLKYNLPLRAPAIDIHRNATWIQNALTVAGGNGKGNGLNQFTYPWGLYVDDDQTIYVADTSSHRIVEWKRGVTSGQVVAGRNGQGNGAHQLHNPRDVIVDKERDSLIICDQENRRVVRWPRRNGTNGETIISNIFCTGLTMDENGSLYVVNELRHEVRLYRIGDTQGTVVAGGNGWGNRTDQLFYPEYIFVDRDHSVYVSDYYNHRVMKWEDGAKQGIVVAGGQGNGSSLTQ